MTEIKTPPIGGLRRCIPWLAAAILSLPFAAGAAEPDLHDLFEARCGSCHGHAGPFARETLVLVDGVLRGRKSGREIAAFLPGHHGRLTPSEADALIGMFTDQVRSGGLFEDNCRICHVRASELARDRLIVLDGVLRGRYSGREIRAYLRNHGRLTSEEAEHLTRTLTKMVGGEP